MLGAPDSPGVWGIVGTGGDRLGGSCGERVRDTGEGEGTGSRAGEVANHAVNTV